MADFAPKKPLRPVASVSAPPTNGCAAFVTRGRPGSMTVLVPELARTPCPTMCGKSLCAATQSPHLSSDQPGMWRSPSTLGRWLCPRRLEPPGSAGACPADCALRAPKPRRYVASGHQKLGRFHQPGHRVTHNRKQNSRHAGWEYVHVAQDDHSRVSFACIQPDEKPLERLPGFGGGGCASTARLASPSSVC